MTISQEMRKISILWDNELIWNDIFVYLQCMTNMATCELISNRFYEKIDIKTILRTWRQHGGFEEPFISPPPPHILKQLIDCGVETLVIIGSGNNLAPNRYKVFTRTRNKIRWKKYISISRPQNGYVLNNGDHFVQTSAGQPHKWRRIYINKVSRWLRGILW